MQRCNCTVRLSGDVGNTVAKFNVSPAEIVLLNAIHGEGSVVEIQKTEMDKMPHKQERDKLVLIYGAKIVDKIFPGEFSKLPVSLSEISVEPPAEAETAEVGADEPVVEAAEEVAQEAPAPDAIDEDDKALRDLIVGAKSKMDLYEIAKDNEVDLTKVPDKADAIKAHILASLKLAA